MFAIKTNFNLQLMGFHFHEEIINKLHIYTANTFLCVEKSFQIYQWEKDSFLYAYKLTLLNLFYISKRRQSKESAITFSTEATLKEN